MESPPPCGPTLPFASSPTINGKKRVLSDSEDLEEPEVKHRHRRPPTSPLPELQATGSSLQVLSTNSCAEEIRQPSAGPSTASSETLTSGGDRTASPQAEPSTPLKLYKGKTKAISDDGTKDGSQKHTVLQQTLEQKSKLLQRHENIVTSFQQSLSCQICLDLMHRPFALSPCGHSASPPPDFHPDELPPVWLRKKTCPHCRTVITEAPIEVWAVKDMVATLVKSGLVTLPADSEERAAGEVDPDPWKTIFQSHRHERANDYRDLVGIRDDEDGGIYRCVDCYHEIEDGVCTHCARDYAAPGQVPEVFGDDYYDDDDDDDLDDGDEVDEFVDGVLYDGPVLNIDAGIFDLFGHMFGPDPYPAPRAFARDDQIDLTEDSDTGEHNDSADEGYEDSFIDDGEIEERRRDRERRDIINIDEEEDEGEGEHQHDEDQSDVEFVGFGGRRPRRLARGPVVLSDEDEDEALSDELSKGEVDEVDEDYVEMYGDDGSLPARDSRYSPYDDDSEDEYAY
ncbi:uncharacterized protein BXZ73DRAFT_78186 [Epithele typhae]|uniref:uncharacterized protein n=1 Tax=Epithele typhae TaxID=378194 RepID=UPI0020086A81|nr:uncharacterized protein BXZ73DRAFT_78186 [Epithele typhae]KAH9929030.1 hypothetical protein BXZ73DRAFT_78186 [Epithele typhae]